MTSMADRPDDDAAGLIEAGRASSDARDPSLSLRAAISNAMAGLKAKWYGKGPERARTYLADDNVFVVMEGGLTTNEETLLAHGRGAIVRQYRLEFEETMRATAMQAVADLTGRAVLDYHSQILFDPPRSLEWFVLGAPAGAGRGAAPGA